jgi:hypothetical protein
MKKLSVLMMTCLVLFAHAKTPDLDNMTDEEKQITGISKLSATELEALQQWYRNQQQQIDREIRQRNAGFEARREGGDRRTIRARLEKMYEDKLGNTFYELNNGQIWKRISNGNIFMKDDGPQVVTVEPAMFGSWELRGDGNRSVKVKRIK